jgi:hypothetical protein
VISAQVLVGLAASLASAAAFACGFHDGTMVRRGTLNLAFPNALYVGAAVWQAQLAGVLQRDELWQRDDLTAEARGALGLIRANTRLRQLGARLDGVRTDARPGIALVLLGPVLWTRFEAPGGTVGTKVHVDGPERGDAVIVTELPVVEALAAGRMTFDEALDLGVVRLYGPPAAIAATRTWLGALQRD